MSNEFAEVLASVIDDDIEKRLKHANLEEVEEGQVAMSYKLTEIRLFRSDVIKALNNENGLLKELYKGLLVAQKDPVIDNVINFIVKKA